MLYAVIENNVVTNTILAEPEFAETYEDHLLVELAADSQVSIGWEYDGENFNAPIPDIEVSKSNMWERIKAERTRRVQLGGYQVGAHWYNSDTFSRTQQIGLVMLGQNLPVGIMWKTLDNGFVEMTPTLASQIFIAAVQQDAATFAASVAHQTAMEASPDPLSYDYLTTGWPEIYEGPQP